MKRILLVAVSSSALVFAAPAIASAHHHHAKRHHKHHAARARVLDFRASAAPASPATPATPSTETVGKVASFKEGVLTITLNNGTQVSGKVTEKTEIHCPSTASPSTNGGGDDEQGDSGDQGGSGGDHGSSGVAHEACNGDQGGSDQQSCTTAALVEGALVREAELTLTGEGAVWDKVDLA